ncbi:hypothetical protein ASF91_20740 [Rhizobium sp. Leaf155]|nr:hypothetical protein ASF91_20740 [Rhizobium sp. Leaf155]
MSEISSSDALKDFVSRFSKDAERQGLPVSAQPKLTGYRFSGSDSEAATIKQNELPSEVQAYKIGRYTIIFGSLPETPTLPAVRESLRRYRNQCVIARSFLSTNESLDLQLYLMGPRGSEWERQWKSLGLFLERDDRVARKLAWLRPRDPQRDDESFAEFVRRTFIARPWEDDDAAGSDRALDLEEPSPAGLPRTTAEEFDSIALGGDEERSGEEIVDALVRAWEQRGKS